jgi:hypothetical protein
MKVETFIIFNPQTSKYVREAATKLREAISGVLGLKQKTSKGSYWNSPESFRIFHSGFRLKQ